MADQITEVSSQSWFSRLGGAFKGIVVGLFFFFGAFLLLFWNEGRAVKRHKALQEGGAAVISVSADRVEAGNEGKLVHTSGQATTGETLSDRDFPVSENALRLRRTVEMYQWQESSTSETKQKLGGGTETVTTYSYSKGWSDRVISSSSFKEPSGHENPGQMRFSSEESQASRVTLAAFDLPPSMVGRISNWQRLDPVGAEAGQLPAGTLVQSDGYYLGADPSAPQVGDLRIRFEAVKPGPVSIVARQVSNTFEAYTTSNGGTISLLELGTKSAEAMFQAAEAANKTMTWILRALGFFVMFLGLKMILAPLKVLADVVPLFGKIVGAGTGMISFLVAGMLSFLTIAVAWIVYRPLLGIVLLAVAGGITFLVVKKMRGVQLPPAPAPAAAPPPAPPGSVPPPPPSS